MVFGKLLFQVLRKGAQKVAEAVDERREKSKCEDFIRAYRTGTLQPLRKPPVILQRDEDAFFSADTSVLEIQKKTIMPRLYGGTRINLGSLPVYVGASVPLVKSIEKLVSLGEGVFVVTDRRVIVSGTRVNAVHRFEDITDVNLFEDAIQIVGGPKGGRFYKLDEPSFAATVIWTLIRQPEQEEPSQSTHEENVDFLKKHVKDNPDDWKAYLQLGVSYLQTKDYDKAIDALNKSIAINPISGEAHTSLGMVYLKKGQRKKAEAAFKEAVSVDSESPEALLNLGLFYAGITDGGKHTKTSLDEGIKLMKKAAEIDNKSAAVRYGLGLAYLLKNDTARARKEYQQLRKLNADMATDLYAKITEVE